MARRIPIIQTSRISSYRHSVAATPKVRLARLPVLLKMGKMYRNKPDIEIDIEGDIWDRDTFREWFLRCLHKKINYMGRTDRGWGRYDDEHSALAGRDRREIEDYLFKRIRHTGCRNLLSTLKMKRRYPEIDNQRDE